MWPRIVRSIAPILLFTASSLIGAENWAQLKIGMSAEEATEALGVPLIKTAANGFELWIYDNHAEAVFYGGPLVGWTTPTKGTVTGHAVDVWQSKAGQTNPPMFILPRTPIPVKPGNRTQENGVFSLPYYRIRN